MYSFLTFYHTNLATLTFQEAINTFTGIAGAFAGIVATFLGALQALLALCRHFYEVFLTKNNTSVNINVSISKSLQSLLR